MITSSAIRTNILNQMKTVNNIDINNNINSNNTKKTQAIHIFACANTIKTK